MADGQLATRLVDRNGANKDYKTWDVTERQVLIEMTGPGRDRYHHYILFYRVEAAKWIILGPEGNLELYDLVADTVVVLMRATTFPEEGRPFLVLDKITESELGGWRARAAMLAEVHGVSAVAVAASLTAAGTAWRFGDTAHPQFGKTVAAEHFLDQRRIAVRGELGALQYDEGPPNGWRWTAVELVRAGDLEAWMVEKQAGAGRDPRLLDVKPKKGERLTFRAAAAHFDRSQTAVNLHKTLFGESPSACLEVVDGILASELEPPMFAVEYLNKSGTVTKSGISISFIYDILTLHYMAVYDRLNLYRLASAEHLCRHILQTQRAVKKAPKGPSFDGLGIYMRHAEALGGEIHAPTFGKYVSELQKVEGKALANERITWEEIEKAAAIHGKGGGKAGRETG